MDILNDIRDVFKDRFKGAFGGTFILVWLVMNWEFVYMLFNFDTDCTYNDKLYEINEYMRGAWPWRMLCAPIMWSLGSIFTYALFNHLSIFIISIFSLRLKPHILKWAGSKKLVTREDYETIIEQIRAMEEREERKIRHYTNLEKLNAENVIKNERLSEENEKIAANNRDISETNNNLLTRHKKELDALNQIDNARRQILSSLYRDRRVFGEQMEIRTVEPEEIFKGSWRIIEKGRNQDVSYNLFGSGIYSFDERIETIDDIQLIGNDIAIIRRLSNKTKHEKIDLMHFEAFSDSAIGIRTDDTVVYYRKYN